MEYGLDRMEFAEGDLAVDIGANVGEVSLILARRGLRIIAVEPDPLEFKALISNLPDGARCFQEALWSEPRRMELHLANDSGDTSLLGEEGRAVSVSVTTLDLLLSGEAPQGVDIGLLKLEAEGAEPEVLHGAKSALQKTKWVTVDAGPERGEDNTSTLPAVVTFLLERGFAFESVQPARLTAQFISKRREG